MIYSNDDVPGFLSCGDPALARSALDASKPTDAHGMVAKETKMEIYYTIIYYVMVDYTILYEIIFWYNILYYIILAYI